MTNRTRLLVLGLVCWPISPGRADDESKAQLKLLQGSWKAVSWELNGKPELERKRFATLVIDGSQFKLTCENGKEFHPTFKIDVSANPRLIDFTFPDGNRQGQTFEGIFEVAQDTLKLCMCVTPNTPQRPTRFATAEGSSTRLVIFKRDKQKQQGQTNYSDQYGAH